jgi:DNA end-binding protein Ku
MARALWSGTITFGLVNIPVKLYRATAPGSGRSISFHLLHRTCGGRIKNVRRCSVENVDVPWQDVVKGYEVEKGRYVRLEEAELDELLPKDDYAQVAIESFAKLEEIDPLVLDRAYYISPDGPPRAYALLHRALQGSGRVAVSRVMLRTRSHLAMVRAADRHLLLHTMFYPEEIVDAGEVPGLPETRLPVEARQVHAAEQLIDAMTAKWDPARYHDEYAERVHRVIEEKVERGAVTEAVAPLAPERGEVVDLLEALRRSVAQSGEHAAARPRRTAEGLRRTRVSTGASRRAPARGRRGSRR